MSPSPAALWTLPPARPIAGRDEVHVWRAFLDPMTSRAEDLARILTQDERQRAERFYSEKDRRHYIVGRAILRRVLGAYLQIEPERVRFCYSPLGKPFVGGESRRNAVRFNVSHSGRIALYAMTCSREIGIDVERLRTDVDSDRIAQRFLTARETAMLRALPPNLRSQAFFACWTRKEACLKAKGEGLTLRAEAVRQEAPPWSLIELTPAPGFVAALCVEGHGWKLRCWQWPGREPARRDEDPEGGVIQRLAISTDC